VKELKHTDASLFCSLLNKQKTSMKTDSDADEPHKPKWFIFKTMANFYMEIIGQEAQ
jgi:hypothetical protein